MSKIPFYFFLSFLFLFYLYFPFLFLSFFISLSFSHSFLFPSSLSLSDRPPSLLIRSDRFSLPFLSLSPSLPAGAAPSPPPASGRPLPSPGSGRGGGGGGGDAGGAGGGVVAVVEETFPRASKAAALTSPALAGASSPSALSQLRPTPGRRVPPCTGGAEAQAAPPHPRVAAHRCPVAKCL